MAYARTKMHQEVGNNLLNHEIQPTDLLSNGFRSQNTFKSTFSLAAPITNAAQKVQSKNTRDRQFAGNAVQPPAVRQSYQDSDIFGTKGGRETVASGSTVVKEVKKRQQNTFATSNVLGNEQPANMRDGGLHNANSTRKEANWDSNVFGGPTVNKATRKALAPPTAGKEGIYGNLEQSDTWQRKVNLAGSLSQKEATRPPNFEDAAAEDRKMRELYGNSQYAPLRKQPIVKEPTGENGTRKDRKATNLQSSILTHEDESLRNARKGTYDQGGERAFMATNASWNNQNGFAKPNNTGGKVDPYARRQDQLQSNVLEQTDYSSFKPQKKKQEDLNNPPVDIEIKPANKKVNTELNAANGKWTHTDVRGQIKNKEGYNTKFQKQGQLTSSLDNHSYTPAQKTAWKAPDEYAEKHNMQGVSTKQKNLASNLGGLNAMNQYSNSTAKTDILDLVIMQIPNSPDGNIENKLKRIAGVKHVFSCEVDIDNFTGQCRGNGRVKLRLGPGDPTAEQVRSNYVEQGFLVKDYKNDPAKKPGFTQPREQIQE